MAFDAHKNFAVSSVAVAPSPAASGTSLTVATGEGARFPAAPFNGTVCPAQALATPANAEIVRVTAIAGDVLTIVRAQEGTTARAMAIGDLIAATITAKTVTDIERPADLLVTNSVAIGAGFPAQNGAVRLESATAGPWRGVIAARNAANTSDITIAYVDSADQVNLGYAPGGVKINSAGNVSVNGQLFLGTTAPITYPAAATARFNPATGPGIAIQPVADNSGGSFLLFHNASNAIQGSISSPTPTTTAYNTTSDQRLKRDRGIVSDTDVLARTVVHAFEWKADGIPGRGVFAQEAITVAPFAVSEGTDERDEQGRLTHPWGVDYSKYVPDLIVGWQSHDADLVALRARLAFLEEAATATQPIASLRVLCAAIMARVREWLAPLRPAKV
jgi:hypothetical protein